MSLKAKLRSDQVCVGSWVTIAHPAVAEIMANAGFDWLAVDLEHTSITLRECEDLIRTIDSCGVSPLVRLTSNDPDLIKRVLDCGAHGIIVPMVNSLSDAQNAVNAAYYPPRGKRGVGLGRASGYGARFGDYKIFAEREIVIVAQIEHIDAVRNVKEIINVSDIDAFIVGPYDLSGSLGKPGDFSAPEFVEAMKAVNTALRDSKKPGGYHIVEPDETLVQQKLDEGYRFIGFSVDARILDTVCRGQLKKMKDHSASG